MFLAQLLLDAVHLRACLIDRHAGVSARDDVAGVAYVASFPILSATQHPQRRRALMREVLRRDADNCVWLVVEQDLFFDDVLIACEAVFSKSGERGRGA